MRLFKIDAGTARGDGKQLIIIGFYNDGFMPHSYYEGLVYKCSNIQKNWSIVAQYLAATSRSICEAI